MGLNRQLDAAQVGRRIELDLYFYSAIFNTLGGAATATVNVPVTNDSDFVLDAINLVAYTAAGVFLVEPDYQIGLTDSGSGRNLQDAPVHVANITGSGMETFRLPEPKLFKGSATIQVTLVNNTAVAAKVDVALIGRKIFYLGNFSRDQLVSMAF
jgi:hypothetical protein